MSLGLVSCGTTTIVKEVPQTTLAPAPVVVPSSNKYEKYVEFVKSNSGQANSYTDSQLIETGDLVCNALDAGNQMSRITDILQNNAQNQSDLELYAAVMYGAIQHICPEYMDALRSYLNGGF